MLKVMMQSKAVFPLSPLVSNRRVMCGVWVGCVSERERECVCVCACVRVCMHACIFVCAFVCVCMMCVCVVTISSYITVNSCSFACLQLVHRMHCQCFMRVKGDSCGDRGVMVTAMQRVMIFS